MLVNVTNEQGTVNAALRNWDAELQRNVFELVVGTVVHTDSTEYGNGAAWQIRGESSWVDGAWLCESGNGHVYDGVRVEITGRTVRWIPSKVGYGVRCKITFVADGEEDGVFGGWMKV